MSNQPLTKRQHEVLEFVRAFIASHGYAPSLEELCRGLGLSALATAHKHLENLKRKGHITREWNRSRSTVIRSQCPTCGRDYNAA